MSAYAEQRSSATDPYEVQLNRIYQDYLDARECRELGKHDDYRKHAARALMASCMLLRDILQDPRFEKLLAPPEDFSSSRDLVVKKRLSEFLDHERALLACVKLEQGLIDELLEDTQTLLMTAEPLDIDLLKAQLSKVADLVCKNAEHWNEKDDHPFQIKRILQIGGGLLIIILNSAPPIAGIPVPFLNVSLILGGGLFTKGLSL